MKHFSLLFALLFLLFSCKYQLTNRVEQWNPYKTGDVLVFESNTNQLDTFIVTKINKNFIGKNEILEVQYSYFDKTTPLKVDTVNSWIMALTAWENGKSVLSINLNTRTARFAPFNAKRITWLDSLSQNQLSEKNNNYKDVVLLEPDSNSLNYSTFLNDSVFVNKIFWSKSNGLIKYELKHTGIVWTLKEKYSL